MGPRTVTALAPPVGGPLSAAGSIGTAPPACEGTVEGLSGGPDTTGGTVDVGKSADSPSGGWRITAPLAGVGSTDAGDGAGGCAAGATGGVAPGSPACCGTKSSPYPRPPEKPGGMPAGAARPAGSAAVAAVAAMAVPVATGSDGAGPGEPAGLLVGEGTGELIVRNRTPGRHLRARNRPTRRKPDRERRTGTEPHPNGSALPGEHRPGEEEPQDLR
jgi:hypothetical protein